MKKIFLFLSLLVTAGLAIPSQGQTSGTPFSSSKGFFTVRMPGSTPKEEPANNGYAYNGSVTSIDGETTYVVEYRCFCDRIDQPEQAIQQFIRIMSELKVRTGGTIVSQTDLELQDSSNESIKYPGKEVKLEFGSSSAIYHIYLADTKIYLLSVTSEKAGTSAEASDFFGSFHRGVERQWIRDDPKASGILGGVPGPIGGVKEIPKDAPRMATDKSGPNLPPRMVNRSEGVIKGNAISLVTPVYPMLARQGRIQGKAIIDILIDEEGNVISASAECGHPLLVAAAIKAARESVFKPTTLAGVPVKVMGVLTYNFTF